MCSAGGGKTRKADTDELELLVNGSQDQAASDGPLPQPLSVAAVSNTFVEEYSIALSG